MPHVSGFLEKVLYSNVIIALASSLYTLEYYITFDKLWNCPYLLFVFSISLAHYNLHRLVGLVLDQPIPYNERLKAIEKNVFLQSFFFLTGTLIALYLFLSHAWYKEVIFYIPILLGLLYTVPILTVRLRDIPFLKTFFIGLTWMAVSVILPQFIDDGPQNAYWLYAFEKFAFIVAITLPFDLRDIQRDLHTQTKTIANQFGYRTVMEWSAVFFLLSQFCHYQLFLTGVYDKFAALSLMVFNILCYIVVLVGCRKRRNDAFYLGILDGLIVIQGLIYIVWYNLDS